ncbi:MAG TPA: hypothetical protein VF407_21105 [Polyangiaceae bacterium]
MSSLEKWRGVKDLVVDAVDHGSQAIEKIHLASSQRVFGVIRMVPGADVPARLVENIYEGSVKRSYGSVRFVAKLVGGAVDFGLQLAGAKKKSE